MKKSQELKKAAAESASAAAEYGQHALKEGLERAQDLLDEARHQAGPLLHDAKVRSADFASRRLDDLEPVLKDALDKVNPAVEAARELLEDDLLPKLQDALHAAAEHPAFVEASKRGGAAVAALKGELEVKPKKSKTKAFFQFLAIGAIVAGAVAAVRHFLAPKDDGWTAHEPSKAYVNNNDTFSTAAKFAADTAPEPEADEVVEPAEVPETETEVEEVSVFDIAAEEQPNDGAPEEPYNDGGTPEPLDEPGVAADENSYGEGAYMGTEPPEGFTIKGNERSKKYHMEGSGGYDRTIAEVWFNSEEAAKAAGFTRAQR